MAPIRMSGMNSGLDTESIVKALVSGYETKKQKVEKNQTKLEWSQEIWKGVNSKVYSLYTGLDKVRFSSSYKSKKTSVSDPSKATVTAGSGAVNGTQKLKIKKMAAAGYLTGAKIEGKNGDKVTSSTKLSDLGIEAGSQVTLNSDGKETAITIDEDMKVSDFVSKLREGGVNASFDESNGRFFISAKESGAEHDFKLTGTGTNGVAALKSLGLFTKSDEEVDKLNSLKNYGTFNNGKLDESATLSDLKDLFNSYKSTYSTALSSKTSLTTELGTLNDSKAALEGELSTLNDEYSAIKTDRDARSTIVDYLTYKKTVAEKKASVSSDADLADDSEYQTAKANAEAIEATLSDPETHAEIRYQVNQAMAAYDDPNTDDATKVSKLSSYLNHNTNKLSDYESRLTSKQTEIDDKNARISDKQSEIDTVNSKISAEETKMSTAVSDLKNTGLFDSIDDNLDSVDEDDAAAAALSVIKDAAAALEEDGVTGATRVRGEDAEIYLNGAMFTSDSNNFNINGLSINVTGVTGDDEISLTTSTDTDAIYDKVKDFMTQYSDLINELQGLYNADSAKDYEPLTEDQKAEMSDTEIEKWESKIKDSLLRRDTTLGGVISTMSTAMSQGYTVTLKDGTQQNMALSSLGIHTLGFLNAKTNEQYAFHIDGDEEDEKTSASQDKLRAMIESDPDAVADLMSQVAQGLYKALDTKIGAKTSETSSAYTIYNDKQMTKQIDQYKKDVKEWATRIEDSEEMYYKRFTAMEKALANINSSQSALTGMIG